MSQVQKYSWLIDTIYRAKEISLQEINKKWVMTDMSGGLPLLRQTFFRWKSAILMQFGIIIECRLKGGCKYYIANPEVLKEGDFNKWLMDSFMTMNTVSQNLSIKDRILVEDIPSSHHCLESILRAMRENRVLKITHRGFGKGRAYTFKVEPYCVRMFQKRWYLLARSINGGKLRLYGVDRLEQVDLTGLTFQLPDDFEAKDYFSSFFGIVTDEDTPQERVVLRANRYHQHYLRSLPLHHTQREIYTCEDYADFELYLRPTYDFCMELLKYGTMVEVLEPSSLRQQMYAWVRDLWKMYKS